jgi:two-component system sensor histidine kinase ChiS
MAVMFTDIRAYTSLSEAMSPEENFAFVNVYMSRMGPAVRQHGGFIDKYIGDAIMALFPRSADDALAAAVEMQRRLVLLNSEREALGEEPVYAGIGLHFGSVMLGIVGEEERLDGTVISDVVNTASRIEGLCKYLGAPLLVSEAILATCNEPDVSPHRYLGSVAVAGKRERLRIFEVIAAGTPQAVALKVDSRAAFERGVAALEQEDFVAAVGHFEDVLRHDPSDEPARLHLERASSRDGRMTAPPKG